ncbi:hypothetical protein [Intrasporangium sp.]|uniref:hypothetical protein n=1 Tax=Intrasporangium sp. TaxID=1925024 RepID=UPI002D76892C|nr:hypothetical protein [Intrasporangium sp.]
MQCDIVGVTAQLAQCHVDEVDLFDLAYDFGSPSTGGLWQALVPSRRGNPGTYYIKLKRHPRHWPRLRLLPEGPAQEAVLRLPWRHRLDMYLAGIEGVLPEGMRAPALYHFEVFDDEHVGAWWELVRDRGGRWSADELGRAAYLLGRLAARRREGAEVNNLLPAYCHDPDGSSLRSFVEHQVLAEQVPQLRDDRIWHHPVVEAAVSDTGDARLRGHLLDLVEAIPLVLERLEEAPRTYAHGDAATRNLLRPPDEPDVTVVTGWGFASLLPVGFDLGQLLVGQAEDGFVDPAELPRLAAVVCDGYRAGLDAEGYAVNARSVTHGFLGSLLLRSAFGQLPVETLSQAPTAAAARLVRHRLELTRAIVELTAPAVNGSHTQ